MATAHAQPQDRTLSSRPPRMSEEEFIHWCGREDLKLVEWVDGEVLMMAPIGLKHDRLQWWLRNLVQFFVVARKLGAVTGPEYTMRLTLPDGRISRRDPDVLFVAAARMENLRATHLEGPADLAIEIVSPDSVSRDWRDKYWEYEAGGIGEYWIVDPLSERVEAYFRQENKFKMIPQEDEMIRSSILPGWYLKPSWLWPEEQPDVRDVLSELGIQ